MSKKYTVKEVIEMLKQFPENLEVWVECPYREDEPVGEPRLNYLDNGTMCVRFDLP